MSRCGVARFKSKFGLIKMSHEQANTESNRQSNEPAMSEQQRRFSSAESGAFNTYKNLAIGDGSLLELLGYELYSIFCMPVPGVIGYGLRQLVLPLLLKQAIKPAVGVGVTVRHPSRIKLGRGAMIDDYAVLDIRINKSESANSSDAALKEEQFGIEIGERALVGRGTILCAKNGRITLGTACNISSYCRIATQSQVTIGASTLLAAYAYIGPGNHLTDDPTQPIIEQGMHIQGGVTIGDNVWIGTRATVLDGVTIGSNAIVGAHSLVREDVPEGAVVAGVPAKIIRYR